MKQGLRTLQLSERLPACPHLPSSWPQPALPLGPGRLTGLHGVLSGPSRPWEAGPVTSSRLPLLLGEAPGGAWSCGQSSTETCRFVLRTHNAAFTHCPDFRNWAGRCLVMLAGLWVNALDLAYVVAQRRRPRPCFYPISLWPRSLQDRRVSVCAPRHRQVHADFQIK